MDQVIPHQLVHHKEIMVVEGLMALQIMRHQVAVVLLLLVQMELHRRQQMVELDRLLQLVDQTLHEAEAGVVQDKTQLLQVVLVVEVMVEIQQELLVLPIQVVEAEVVAHQGRLVDQE